MSQDLQVASSPSATVASRWHDFKLFGADGFNFRDVLDLVNPLQHIPVVGNLYRHLTGDIAAPAIRIAGGALFGGPLGAAFAAATVLLKEIVAPDGPAAAADTAPDTALAAVPTESRGGWMVATSRAFPLPATSLPGTAVEAAPAVAGPEPRRGGWMVQAAYALADVEERREHLFKSFRVTA